ncbi:IS3 family transposase [Klebsiella pneumoniae]|uniref:IS3 family transposase n=1 Tax=Klebsiella pneumoniae TaxID=573 RepID=UPI0011E4D9F8|nr:IS3 family transposase [Klebsiella pneumoniae]
MAKPKYSPETKLAVVNHYLSGKDGEQSTADLFGIERTSVRRWVRAWQFHGAEGLTAKNNHYSDEFKLVVVRAVISDRLTMREAAARFNLSAEILVRRWLDVYNDAGAEGLLNMQCGRPGQMTKPKNIPPLTDKELEKLSPEELRAELRYLRAENAYPKKVESLGSERKKWQKALIISELRHEHALRDLLRAAGMSRSTWYYNMNALKQGDRYAGLKENIRKIYHYHKGRYGYRRITLALRKQGLRINHKTVQRLMAELSLRSVIRAKKYRAWKGRTGEAAPNIPYSLSERPVMEMVNTMLDGAFPKLRPGDAPLLHSDQGWHYRMRSYQERLKARGMTQSMSRKGNCLDNAVMENFFGTLKSECFYLREFRSVSALRKAVEDYIHYYNNERISLKLKGLSPVEYRTQALRAA